MPGRTCSAWQIRPGASWLAAFGPWSPRCETCADLIRPCRSPCRAAAVTGKGDEYNREAAPFEEQACRRETLAWLLWYRLPENSGDGFSKEKDGIIGAALSL